MFFCPHRCCFVFCDNIGGGGGGGVHCRKFAQARRDQNRSTIWYVIRGVFSVNVRPIFVPSSIKMHQYIKRGKGSLLRNTRLQRNEYQGIKRDCYGALGYVHILTTTTCNLARTALGRSEKLYAGKFYTMDTLSCFSIRNSVAKRLNVVAKKLNVRPWVR